MKKEFDPEQLNHLFPSPVVLVSCSDGTKDNIITIAWCGIVSSHPPTLSISIRPSRHSYSIIKQSKEFVVNIPSEKILKETDACGVLSGKEIDKFSLLKLSKEKSLKIKASALSDCLISLECKVKQILNLGSHDCFIAEIVCVRVDESLLREKEINLKKLSPFILINKQYWNLNKKIGDYGLYTRKDELNK
jgi:flavin reductase (DIM6/NTAB) family NADH-FMN oxidoreductase RutF